MPTNYRILQPLLLLLALAGTVWGQYTTGRVEGSIVDPAGASVSAAKVSLTSLETNAVRVFTTAEDGNYLFAAVPPGRYRLAAEKAGFATVTAELAVTSSQTVSRTVTLAVGQIVQSTTVVDSVASLQQFEPLRSTTRTALEIQTLPNLSRNVVPLITTAPGVTPTFNPRGGSLTTLNIAQAGQFNANGGRSKANAHQLDFTDANDWEFGGIALATQPTPDMLQEVRLLTNNWNAEYGLKSNGQVLMVTRAGTNNLHGSAYNFHQNAALNARDYFDRTGRATPLVQNFYGVTAGAPLWRDRTFLFGGWEGRQSRGASSTTLVQVPTQIARDRATDANARQLLGTLPLPTGATANPNIGTVAVSVPSPTNSNQFLLRGDHIIREGQTLTARYYQNVGSGFNRTAGNLPGYDAQFEPVGRNAMLAHTWVLSPTVVNEARAAYGRSSALFTPEVEPATPRFNITGVLGFGTTQSWPQGRIFNVYQLNDTLSVSRGRHFIKAGFDLRHIQDNSINDSNRRGIYTFPNLDEFLAGRPSAWTQAFGNTYRGFRTNYHGAFVQDDWKLTPALTLNLGLRWEYQDGLREVNSLQSVLDPRLTGAIGQAGTGALGAFRTQNPLVEGNANLWAPRFGFAWNPRRDRLVIRGGYGIYYDSLIFNGLQAGRTTPPINYTGALTGAALAGGNSFARLLAGTADIQQQFNAQIGGFGTLTNLGSITSSLPNLRNPYAQHFSLGTQVRLAASTVLDVSYVGTKGTALTTFGPGNSVIRRPRPAVSLEDETARLEEFRQSFQRQNGVGNPRLDPRFNDVNLLRDNGSSIYHSLQTEFRHNLAYGLTLQASYTWSKSIDNSSDYSPGQATTDRSYAQDQFDFRNERAVSQFDIPHRLIFSHVWQIPVFRTQRGVAGRLLGGWTFASLNQWQSGVPYTVLSGPRRGINDVNLDGQASGLDNTRANCAANGVFRFGEPGVNTRYSQPLLGNNGTCGRNTERMNPLLNMDWTFAKNIRLFEQGAGGSGPWGVEFRADLFNVLNLPFLTAAGDDFRNIASPGFGVANAAAPSRRIQLALRLTW